MSFFSDIGGYSVKSDYESKQKYNFKEVDHCINGDDDNVFSYKSYDNNETGSFEFYYDETETDDLIG